MPRMSVYQDHLWPISWWCSIGLRDGFAIRNSIGDGEDHEGELLGDLKTRVSGERSRSRRAKWVGEPGAVIGGWQPRPDAWGSQSEAALPPFALSRLAALSVAYEQILRGLYD